MERRNMSGSRGVVGKEVKFWSRREKRPPFIKCRRVGTARWDRAYRPVGSFGCEPERPQEGYLVVWHRRVDHLSECPVGVAQGREDGRNHACTRDEDIGEAWIEEGCGFARETVCQRKTRKGFRSM